MTIFLAVLRLLRPQHYLKNVLIFAPLFFAQQFLHVDLLLRVFVASIGYMFLMGAVYVYNDLSDVEEDRLHPTKRFRPLSSGEVPIWLALVTALFCVIAGLIILGILNTGSLIVGMIYLMLNISYSLGLKHIAILDVAILATGFVLRLFVGAFVAGVALSNWIIVIVYLAALFLGLAKRKDDLQILEETGRVTRKSISGYNSQFVDIAITVIVSVTLVAYILYTVLPDNENKFADRNLYLTSIFVLLAALRYLQITYVHGKSASPVKILARDRFLQAVVLCWALAFAVIIYL